MRNEEGRTLRLHGNAHQVGFLLGEAMGTKLRCNIQRYIEQGLARLCLIDLEKMRHGAMGWLRRLPTHFQEELEGISEGAGIALGRLAEWGFVENCYNCACSGLATMINGNVWIARNNDWCLPDLWGYKVIRNVSGRIPIMTFGMEGDVFTATGFNADQLWLHYHSLNARDHPATPKTGMNCYVMIREALETCSTIEQVEAILRSVDRSDGMILFAVDGKDESFCLFECS